VTRRHPFLPRLLAVAYLSVAVSAAGLILGGIV
jgi:hypothetical protein